MNDQIVESLHGKNSVVQILINSRTKIWDVTGNETMLQSNHYYKKRKQAFI